LTALDRYEMDGNKTPFKKGKPRRKREKEEKTQNRQRCGKIPQSHLRKEEKKEQHTSGSWSNEGARSGES